MEHTDVAVIGAGLLGCFTARALTAFALSVTVLEAREDVCTGISRANTGIVYTGYDTKPGTLKTALCLQANRDFGRLCRELDVPFSRPGSLLFGFGPRSERVLRDKFAQGQRNGVPGLALLEPAAVYAREPHLAPGVTLGLYAPGTGTVDPWALGIAAFENARDNGADFRFCQPVLHMERTPEGFRLETAAGTYQARAVVNCAGLQAAAVRELTQCPAVRLVPSAADYLVLDDTLAGFVRHILFHEPEERGKGLTIVPTVEGALLIGPTDRPQGEAPAGAVSRQGLERLRRLCAQVVPDLPLEETIRAFAGLRPDPFAVRQEGGQWVPTDRSIHSFTVLEEEGLISLVGIKTPGLTCAAALGEHAASLAARHLGGPGRNVAFSPERRGIRRAHALSEAERDALIQQDPAYGTVVCRCRDITLGEVREAVRRGAVTVDGVKRRTGAGMGRCQGARCMQAVAEVLAQEQNIPLRSVTKDGPGSPILLGQPGE